MARRHGDRDKCMTGNRGINRWQDGSVQNMWWATQMKQLIFNNSRVGRWTITMLIWSSGSGTLRSVDKESIGSSGFVAITLFKKSSDSKRERWERPMVTFFNWELSITTRLTAQWRTFHMRRVSAAISSNSGFFLSLIAFFTLAHTSSCPTLTRKIRLTGAWIIQQNSLIVVSDIRICWRLFELIPFHSIAAYIWTTFLKPQKSDLHLPSPSKSLSIITLRTG